MGGYAYATSHKQTPVIVLFLAKKKYSFKKKKGGRSIRRSPAVRSRSCGAGVRDDRNVGAAAVLHLRLPHVGHGHPHRHLRRDQHRHVLLPALL